MKQYVVLFITFAALIAALLHNASNKPGMGKYLATITNAPKVQAPKEFHGAPNGNNVRPQVSLVGKMALAFKHHCSQGNPESPQPESARQNSRVITQLFGAGWLGLRDSVVARGFLRVAVGGYIEKIDYLCYWFRSS